MPVKAKRTTATKRRKKRTVAAKPAAARKKTTRKVKRKTTAARTTTTRRRKVGAKKTAVKRIRKTGVAKKRKTTAVKKRKTTAVKRKRTTTRKKKATGVTRKKRTVTRRKVRKTSAVKKKPSKSKASKKTSKPAQAKVIAKSGALKQAAAKPLTAAKIVRKPARKKRKQTKSDSQALPVVEQKSSLENKMAELKKSKKSIGKKALISERGQESVAVNSAVDLNIAPYRERPGEDYMSANQQAHFRRLLLERKRMLLEDMGRTMHHLQDEGASLPDISDRATQEEEFNLELRARDREHKLIKKIEGALQQLDEGHYGFCNSCGVEIGIRRLEARPTATLCIDCKTLDEIREKQMGG